MQSYNNNHRSCSTSYFTWLILLAIGAAGGYFFAHKYSSSSSGCISEARCALRTGMRKLWSDHVFWTRDFVIEAVAGIGETQLLVARLMQNQEDIGNAIIPYYGKEAGQKLTELLKEHIKIAGDLVAAAKAGEQDKVKEIYEKWQANAKEIATFLSGANPNWPQDVIERMLNSHLTLTAEEVVARITGQWKDDIEAFDKIYMQALDMADHLTSGIVAQFPQKF